MYQLLDEHFIGLIFSVFNSDAASKAGRVQVGDSPQSAAVSACPVHVLHHHPHHTPAACQAFTLSAGVQLSTHSVAPGWLLRPLTVHTAALQVTAFQSVPAGSSGAAPSGLTALGSEDLVGLDSPTVAALRASAGRMIAVGGEGGARGTELVGLHSPTLVPAVAGIKVSAGGMMARGESAGLGLRILVE